MRDHFPELLSERMQQTEIHQLFMLREKAIKDFAIDILSNLDDIPNYEELKRKDGYIEGIEDCILTLRQWLRYEANERSI